MVKTAIVVLAYNRSFLLKQCLKSLIGKLESEDKIILINNHSSADESQKIESLIKRFPPDKLIYLVNQTNSIPKARNLGIKTAESFDLVAFLDDDCRANEDYLLNLKKAHLVHSNWQIIQGKVSSIPFNNLYARLTGLTYQNWLKANLLTNGTLRTFDSKNVSFKNEVLKDLHFNEALNRSSDIDSGQLLKEKGYTIGYSPETSVFHQERTTLFPFLVQHFNIAEGELDTGLKFFPKRYLYHFSTFYALFLQLIKEGEIFSSLKLILLVFLILTIRTAVFLTHPGRYRS